MTNIYDAAHNLAKLMKESEEYKAYKRVKDKIDSDPKIKEMLSDFKKKQFELQAKQLQGQQVSSDEIYKLQQLYQIISLNSDISEFLSKEFLLQRMVADITRIIAEAVEFDTDFLKEFNEK